MKFLIRLHTNGSRSVHLLPKVEMPTLKHPELWVGQGRIPASRGITLNIGGAIGCELNLFQAAGRDPYGSAESELEGLEVLSMDEPSTGWDFAMDFLQFWLEQVFGEEADISYVLPPEPEYTMLGSADSLSQDK